MPPAAGTDVVSPLHAQMGLHSTSKISPTIRSSPRHMKRTPSSRNDRRKSVAASGPSALEGVKKSFARKRRSLLELSSNVTSGLLNTSQPYEEFVPVHGPEYVPFNPKTNLEKSSQLDASQTALIPESRNALPNATAVISQVAARVKQNVRDASVKGKAAVVTAATRLKENVLEGGQFNWIIDEPDSLSTQVSNSGPSPCCSAPSKVVMSCCEELSDHA